jgi:hypothetical protein
MNLRKENGTGIDSGKARLSVWSAILFIMVTWPSYFTFKLSLAMTFTGHDPTTSCFGDHRPTVSLSEP